MAERRRVAIVAELEWPYKRHHHVFAGTQQYAQQHKGWESTIELFPEQSRGAKLGRTPYDGIIARATTRMARWAQRVGVPLVNVWANSPVTDTPLVTPDFEAASRMAAEHLMARGFHRFGFLGVGRQKIVKRQLRAFKATLRAAGFATSPLIVAANYSYTPARWQRFNAQLDDWIDSWSLPIGVYVSYDLHCRYLAAACRRKGVDVPRDAALVGTHNEPMICNHPEPTLSSIELGYDRVGYRAAEILDAMMAGKAAPTEPVVLEPVELFARQSTDALAVDDPLTGEALRFIAEHSHERIKVSDVAAATRATRRTIERRFRDILGRSPAEEIARLRVERAKRLLIQTKTSIKHLAAAAGFHDATQMCVVFKRVAGITPSAYRRQRRRN